jgi:hypothetical protein
MYESYPVHRDPFSWCPRSTIWLSFDPRHISIILWNITSVRGFVRGDELSFTVKWMHALLSSQIKVGSFWGHPSSHNSICKYFTSHTSIDSVTYYDLQLLSVTIGCRPLFQDAGPLWTKFIQPPWLRRVIWQFAKLASTLPVRFQFDVPSDCVDQVMVRSRVQRKYFITLFAAWATCIHSSFLLMAFPRSLLLLV